jgi:gamma-D-glutamyl-L-lysine dipeptidyl-peptidase
MNSLNFPYFCSFQTQKNMIGTITLSIVPIRAEESERSEMISQLLFGEQVEVMEEVPRWLKVRSLSDHYVGWVDKKMVEFDTHITRVSEMKVLANPLISVYKTSTKQRMFISGGSMLGKIEGNQFLIGNENYEVDASQLLFVDKYAPSHVIHTALQFINTPYLWGGKSIFGVDCSGLVQVVYSICGVQLPRDASQQIAVGMPIDSLDNVQEGDLAFFSNSDGDVTHVGLLLSSTEIIHASGCVKIDRIDKNGIISSITGEYLYRLHAIRRVKD